MHVSCTDINIYHIRTNIGRYNIWRFAENMDLVRYEVGEITVIIILI